jgi:hypothetical protein
MVKATQQVTEKVQGAVRQMLEVAAAVLAVKAQMVLLVQAATAVQVRQAL